MVRTSGNLQYLAVVLAAMAGDLSCANARGGYGQALLPSVGLVQPHNITNPSIHTAELIQNAANKPRSQRRKNLRRILRVGPKRKLRAPSRAARTARGGDQIKIDAREYRDCAVWRANDLILEGVGEYAHVRDATCKQEGIWVVRGDRTTVIRIEFSGAHVTANNGAGIKFTGRILIVRNSYFHDNENGIMGGTAVIRYNFLQKGPRAENHMAMIAIGEEGASNPSRGILIERNVFQNDDAKLKQFIWNRSRQPMTMRANYFLAGSSTRKGRSGLNVSPPVIYKSVN